MGAADSDESAPTFDGVERPLPVVRLGWDWSESVGAGAADSDESAPTFDGVERRRNLTAQPYGR